VLVALMIWTPYYIAQAGVITTDQVASTAAQSGQATADRTTVLNFLNRSDVANQLQSMGIDQRNAQERVAAMSDAEAASLAQRINALPAGADDAGWILLLIVIGVGVWWFFYRK
jgi:hypothetical protein